MKIISSIVEVHLFREVKDGIEFLLFKRSANRIYPGIWQMVSGHIDPEEKAYETALRETIEESGVRPQKMWVVPNVNHFYSHENDSISYVPVFAALLRKDDKIVMSEEHCDLKWVSPEQAKLLLAWPGQKHSIDIITEYFTKNLNLLNFTELKI